ncbi:MAG: ribonuclease J [Armatimonadota bacterium]|nr:ribonuclease J [Armatimonadota bacterium]MDR7438403.1 ribonuclease J [Armatimonadota bacterium]MDR7601247.1 ribonuclease J [Armatimonadota bacterium]
MARNRRRPHTDGLLRVIPLGGLGEIGKNATLVQWRHEAVLVDAGVQFPEEELFGVDLVIPDFSVLRRDGRRVLGVLLTHGHEDHVGALPFLLRTLPVPVYGTRLTVGLARAKSPPQATFHTTQPRTRIRLGPFEGEWIRVSHSVPDSCAVALRTPVGMLVFSGDFKFDQTPVDGQPPDLARLAELGEEGVLALFLDSTNVERPGVTPSERVVGEVFQDLFPRIAGRILLTTFATNVHRIQQAMEAAARVRRKVAVVGRSMEEVVRTAHSLGYLRVPAGLLVSVEEANRMADSQVLLLVTGSQGEPFSALARISAGSHRQVSLRPTDTVIFSASPIPGNEVLVARTIDALFRAGAEVIYGTTSGVHVSGHASQEELRLMINLLRPRYVVPVHGEYRHLVLNARLAQSVGIPPERVLVGTNGTVFAFTATEGRVAGREDVSNVLVDGLGVGDVGEVVLRDRQHLARDGIVVAMVGIDRESGRIVHGPEIVTRGFVHAPEASGLLQEGRRRITEAVVRCWRRGQTELGVVRGEIRDALFRFLHRKTGRQPMILPLVVEL